MTLVTDASEIPELALLGVKTAKCAHTGEHASGSCQHDGSDNELESLSHEELAACLLNKSGRVPLPARFRALFALRNLADDAAVRVIGQGKRGGSFAVVYSVHAPMRPCALAIMQPSWTSLRF